MHSRIETGRQVIVHKFSLEQGQTISKTVNSRVGVKSFEDLDLKDLNYSARTKCRWIKCWWTKCRPVLGQGGQNASFIKSYFNEK